MRMPSKETLASLRQQYPPGARVRLIRMDDKYSNLVPGDLGSVQFFDDMATCFVSWDRGSSLGIIWGEDEMELVSE